MSKENPYTITDARYYANKLMGYLARALFVIEPIPRPGLGTFAVDKHWRMYFDPELLGEWTLKELAGVVLHECFHLVLDHANRREMFIPNATSEDCMRWNIAADLAINSVLLNDQIELPKDGIFPGKGQYADLPVGLSTEEYYKRLPSNPPSEGRPEEEGDEPGPSADDPPPGLGAGGSSATDGNPRDWEDPEPEEDSGLGESEQKRVRRAVVEDIREQRSRGSVSSELETIIGKILEPKVDPVQELFTAVKYAINMVPGFGNTTFRRTNRRYPDSEFIHPANVQPVPQVRVLIDSSGSMSEDTDLPLAAGIIARIVRAMPQDGLQVYCADTDLRSCEKVFTAESLKVVGRGGTRMEVAIPKVDEEIPRPDVIICVTDGYTAWPENETRARTIVCLTQNGHKDVPSWITTLEVLND